MKKINLSLVDYVVILFLLCLPFERLLTLEIGGYTAKLSYLVGVMIITATVIIKIIERFIVKISPLQDRHSELDSESNNYLYGFRIKSGMTNKKEASSKGVTFQKEEWWLLGFVAYSFLTLLWTIDFRRTLIISSLYLFMALLFIIFRRLLTPKRRELAIIIIIFLGVATSLFGLWQFIVEQTSISPWAFLRPEYQSTVFGFPRIQSTFIEPLYFANFLIIPFFLAIKKLLLAPLSRELSNRRGYLMSLSFVIISLAIFLTLSRGAFLAVICGLIILFIIIKLRYAHLLKRGINIILLIIIAIIIGSAMIYLSAGREGLKNFFGHAAINDYTTGESVLSRQETMKTAYGTALSMPIGIGAGAFGALPAYKNQIPTKGYQIPNNQYLELWVEVGVVGLIIMVFFWYLIIKKQIQEISAGNFESVVFLAAVGAILVQYLFFSTLYIIYIWFFLALAAQVPPNENTN